MAGDAATKSECPLVAELSNYVKEDSRSGIVSCLTRIKTDQKCSERLMENGGVSLLVELLSYRNMKVLDATLSILANACLLSHVREKVKDTRIAQYVVWILKNLESGDTLHCRACRLMGNLSESKSHATSLCDAGAVSALTETLRSPANAQTLSMAVRAVRNIWSISEGSREKILKAGTIKVITALLLRSRKKLSERDDDTKYTELAESCLKAMSVFVDETDPRSGEQMRGGEGVHGYRCIVKYCRANNKTAIKCLYKLCRTADRRPDLGNCGAIECLVEAVSGGSPSNLSASSSSSTWESLVSLCLFCREAVNRAKIRSNSGLEAILALLAEIEYERYHPMLLHALGQFIWDDHSIRIMVKNGLVDVLVDKLKKMAVEIKIVEGQERAGRNGKKRSADTSPYRKGAEIKYNRTGNQYGRFSSDYPRVDWSPSSSSTAYSSPPSTPPLPPYDGDSDIDENAEDNYSPICSDDEWLDDEDTNVIALDKAARSARNRELGCYSEEEKDEGNDSPQEEPDNFEDKYRDLEEEEERASTSNEETRERAVHSWTLALLSKLSHSKNPIDGLADPTTIQALTGYIASAKNYRASVILTRIIRNPGYFESLLLQGFVFEAQTLYGTEHYTRALCDLAETGGALGELTTLLLRGQESQKFIVALSIPFIVKSREKLRVLLNNHGALVLIFRALNEPDNPLYDEAILAICRLADSLYVAAPERTVERSNSNSALGNIVDDYPTREKKNSCTVTFELDDGSTVEASRASLCEKYEVFSAMLDGYFNESGKSRVRLKNASREGLDTLLTAASGDSDVRRDRTIEAILDAVLLADQFLMFDVSEHLTETSIARLNHENLSRAWSWSRENSCHELQACCVKIFLTSTMTRCQRLRAFRDFSTTPSFHEFIKDVRKIIDDSLALGIL